MRKISDILKRSLNVLGGGPDVVHILCSSVVYTRRRVIFGLAQLFVYVFLLSFKHFDHLAWGKGSWSLCWSCICLLAMHTLICVTFSLPPGVGSWLRLLLVALLELFCLPFSTRIYVLKIEGNKIQNPCISIYIIPLFGCYLEFGRTGRL